LQAVREAEQALRRALEVQTREHLPQEWARTQLLLWGMLSNAGINMADEGGVRRVQEAIVMHRPIFEGISLGGQPTLLASAQAFLGLSLFRQAIVLEDKASMLAEAALAFQQALEVQTREQAPEQWIWMQSMLGLTLFDQSDTAQGSEKTRLLKSAVAVYQQV